MTPRVDKRSTEEGILTNKKMSGHFKREKKLKANTIENPKCFLGFLLSLSLSLSLRSLLSASIYPFVLSISSYLVVVFVLMFLSLYSYLDVSI